jgi:putative flippase GtrA
MTDIASPAARRPVDPNAADLRSADHHPAHPRRVDTPASSTASGRAAQAARAHHPSSGVPGVVPDLDLLSVLASDQRRRAAVVEIVVPVYNEEPGIEASIRRLHRYLTDEFPLPWLITVADNASTDRTWPVACRLAYELEGVQGVHLEAKGRGRALRAAWTASPAPVVAYMDVDLSTDLDALLPLVAPLVSGHSDVAIGTRLAAASRIVRGPKREAISRSYNLLLRATLHNGFSDAQCGFKAVRTDVARALLPLVEDQGWFFDTELLVLAEANGLRIHEVPVDWVDDPDSRVDVVSTARDDLLGIWRMLMRTARGEVTLTAGLPAPTPGGLDAARPGPSGPPEREESLGAQAVRFASIGLVSTFVFAVLYALLFGVLGSVGALFVAFGLCSAVNTAANRRLTFSLSGRSERSRHVLAGAAVAAFPLVLDLAALGALAAAGFTGLGAQLLVLTLVNGVAAVARFLLLRRWVFRPAGAAAIPIDR